MGFKEYLKDNYKRPDLKTFKEIIVMIGCAVVTLIPLIIIELAVPNPTFADYLQEGYSISLIIGMFLLALCNDYYEWKKKEVKEHEP